MGFVGAWPDRGWPGRSWPEDGWPEYGVPATHIPEHPALLYSEFDSVGIWRATTWKRSPGEFSLSVESRQGELKKRLPMTYYDRTTYPDMNENDVGNVIPIAYGRLYDRKATCIGIADRKFKIACHAVYDFTGVRVFDGTTESWVDVTFETTDEANGEFTLSAAAWDGQQDVAADFIGLPDSGGDPMVNASDVVKDVLVVRSGYSESADLHAASFSASRAKLVIGTDIDGVEVHRGEIALYLDDDIDIDEVVAKINGLIGSYLFDDVEGKFRYVVFEPEPGEGLPSFEEREIFSFEETTENEAIVSKVRVGYQERPTQDYSQWVEKENTEYQYAHGMKAAASEEIEIPADQLRDADHFASRTLRMDGNKQRTYRAVLSHRAWPYLPTQKIILNFVRGATAILEILEVKKNLIRPAGVDVVLGDLHGLGGSTGFVCGDSPTLPTRFANLAGYGSGAAEPWNKDWDPEIKLWARQNIAYVCDDNGFADPTDPDSYLAGVVI